MWKIIRIIFNNKFSRLLWKGFSSFFVGEGQFQPLYFWVSLFNGIVVFCLVKKIIRNGELDFQILITLIGQTVAYLGFYVFNRRSKNNGKKPLPGSMGDSDNN